MISFLFYLLLPIKFSQIIVNNEFNQFMFELDDVNKNEKVNNLLKKIEIILISNYSMINKIGFMFGGKELIIKQIL